VRRARPAMCRRHDRSQATSSSAPAAAALRAKYESIHASLGSSPFRRPLLLRAAPGDDALKGEVFAFASFKSPAVKPEKDALTDEASEQMAVFYERMAVLEEGLQLFDSLFATFLATRLGDGWGEAEAAIRGWLEGA